MVTATKADLKARFSQAVGEDPLRAGGSPWWTYTVISLTILLIFMIVVVFLRRKKT